MIEQTSRLAERVAAGVSRRQFFGTLGRWAGATALAMGGVLATASSARADPHDKTCCYYTGFQLGCNTTRCVDLGNPCPVINGHPWMATATVNGCSQCKC